MKNQTLINIAAIGFEKSGKSTTIGHLMYKCGQANSTKFNTFEKESKQIGKETFKYAWIVDKTKTERNSGLTQKLSFNSLTTKKYRFNIINSPGHRDYLKNIIRGIALADCALLFISADKTDYGTFANELLQIKELIIICYALGVKQIIVVVNRMDIENVKWKQENYEQRKNEISFFLNIYGYNPEITCFVPISGWIGENLINLSTFMPWYKGLSLIEAMNELKVPNRQINSPFRLSIIEVEKVSGIGTIIIGKVNSGKAKIGESISITPSKNLLSTISSIECNHSPLNEAVVGDFIGINVKNLSKNSIKTGSVVGWNNAYSPKSVKTFIAQIIILDCPITIHKGHTSLLICQASKIPCIFDEMLVKLDRKTAAQIEKNPKNLQTGEAAIVKFVPINPLCIEPYDDIPSLGRFVLIEMKKILAVGKVLSVENESSENKSENLCDLSGKED